MDEGGDRRRALHGVRQPGMQDDLGRLAHGADEQQETQDRQRVDVPAEEVDDAADLAGRGREHGVEIDRVEDQEHAHDPEREAEIADPVDDERLDGGGIGRRPVVPMADQEIGTEADALPSEEHLHEVVGRHQHQHAEREQAEVGHEARDRGIVRHVADRIDMHHGRHDGHDDEHDSGQGIDADGPGGFERAGVEPGEQLGRARVAGVADVIEDVERQEHRQQQPAAGDELRQPVADLQAEQAGDQGARERQEDDGDVDHGLALHHVDVFDLDRAAVAEVDDEDGKADGGLGRRHRENEHGEDLADEVAELGREGDEVDVDREQHQLDRHQDDDDVLAVEEDAEDAEREQDRG